jgi:HlyD family secretion protein
MKMLLMNSLIVSSVLAWPITASWPDIDQARHWLPVSLTDSAPSPEEYVTSPVTIDEVVKTTMATGSLIPSLNVEVGSVLSGQIKKLCVDFND